MAKSSAYRQDRKNQDRWTFQRRSILRQYLESGYRTYEEINAYLQNNDHHASDSTIKRDVAVLQNEYNEQWIEKSSERGRAKRFHIKKPNNPAAAALAPFILSRAIRQLKRLDNRAAQDAVVLLSEANASNRSVESFSEQELPYINIGEYNGDGFDVDTLQAIVTAIKHQQVIQFKYRGRRGSRKLPVRMLEYHGLLYVVTWSINNTRYEPYRLDGISDILVTNDRVPHTFNFNDFMYTRFGLWDGPHAEVIIDIEDPYTAANFKERMWHNTQVITDLPNNAIRVTMQCGMSPELISWILHWTPKLKVIAPQELKDMVRAKHLEGLRCL